MWRPGTPRSLRQESCEGDTRPAAIARRHGTKSSQGGGLELQSGYALPPFQATASRLTLIDAQSHLDCRAAFSQKFAGDTYMLTLDGDFQMVYYRSDLFAEAGIAAPETWQDYIAAAKALHGQDMNGDGSPDYGSCISKKRNAQAYWMILSVASGFLQSQGTSQGIFFNADTMEPLVNPSWHFFGLTGPDRGMFSASKHNILGSVMA